MSQASQKSTANDKNMTELWRAHHPNPKDEQVVWAVSCS